MVSPMMTCRIGAAQTTINSVRDPPHRELVRFLGGASRGKNWRSAPRFILNRLSSRCLWVSESVPEQVATTAPASERDGIADALHRPSARLSSSRRISAIRTCERETRGRGDEDAAGRDRRVGVVGAAPRSAWAWRTSTCRDGATHQDQPHEKASKCTRCRGTTSSTSICARTSPSTAAPFKGWLFRSAIGRSWQLSRNRMRQADVYG